MRLLDVLKNAGRDSREKNELSGLQSRLRGHSAAIAKRRQELLRRVTEGTLSKDADARLSRILHDVIEEILRFEGLFAPPQTFPSWDLSTAGRWEYLKTLTRQLSVIEEPQTFEKLVRILAECARSLLPHQLPPESNDGEHPLSCPLVSLLPDPAAAIEGIISAVLCEPPNASPLPRLYQQFEWNVLTASGINPAGKASTKPPVLPTKAKDKSPHTLVEEYIVNTPLRAYFETLVPFAIPLSARFEHTHIIGGSGHGKTQLLQSLILRDIEQLPDGRGSIVVLDSQGDMIKTILGLAELTTVSDRVVLIDPNDIEYPPCLNLFDFGLERLTRYNPVEREKLINGAIALYEYMFGALLGADLTQRQGVIFRYLARLLMVVPGATIHTLREFMEEPEKARAHLSKLDPVSKVFFETQFFSPVYNDTRQQILTRLWGVISNSVLARMFSHTRNAVDLFAALNRGSLILINTAKDLLKQDGCEILGRFFIALLVQAVQERAAIPEDKRRSTFVYIDEAQDYFDEGIENLLNQARKYKVGLVLAHQNLGQFDTRLSAAVMASTAIKIAGGVSAKDASTLSREMRCETDFLLGMRKHQRATDFACFIRNVTPQPVQLTVPFGQMEGRARMSQEQLLALLTQNRQRYAAEGSSDFGAAAPATQNVQEKRPALQAPELL
jgi:Type IV secretion-system coupling protein DNA-binding domain